MKTKKIPGDDFTNNLSWRKLISSIATRFEAIRTMYATFLKNRDLVGIFFWKNLKKGAKFFILFFVF